MPEFNLWDSLEATRVEVRAQLAGWPGWCWVPSEVTSLWAFRHTAPSGHPGATLGDVEAWLWRAGTPESERNSHLMATMQLAAAATWRLTRGIYRFDPELQRALLQTPIEELAPDVLLQLPEWCLYIDLDGGELVAGDRAVGFYAHLDSFSRSPETAQLRLLVVFQRQAPRRLIWWPRHLPLDHRSLREAWEHLGLMVKDADLLHGDGHEERVHADWESSMRICLPLLLYLARQEPDVRHRHDHERRSERKRLDRPGGGPNWWEVGYRVGAALRARPEPGAEVAPARSGGGGRTPVPHIRRAHYHLYWTGAGRREPRIRWLHPILVGDRQGHKLPPTIRRVETA